MATSAWRNIFTKEYGFPTYGFGLLQAKAYRTLKQLIADALSRYALTPFDWALLGVLYEHPKGIRQRHLAQALGVEPPLVTRQLEALTKKDMIVRVEDRRDQRVKWVTLSGKGKALVPKIEIRLQAVFQGIVGDLSPKDLRGYQNVLEALAHRPT